MKPKNRKMILRYGPLVLQAMLIQGCVHADSPRVRLEYAERTQGPVVILVKDDPRRPAVVGGLPFYSETVENARQNFDGSPAPASAQLVYFRSDFETRGMRIQAWIDLDGDDIARCQLFGGFEGRVAPDCGPEAGDPSGITPPPPYGATIPLVIRDPNQ